MPVLLICAGCHHQNAAQRITCENCGSPLVPSETERVTVAEHTPLVSAEMAVGTEDVPLPDTKKCPYCAELIKYEALKCRHCGEMVEGAPQQGRGGTIPPASAASATTRSCSACGHQNPGNILFCRKCARRLDAAGFGNDAPVAPAIVNDNTLTCSICGQQNSDDALFCKKCARLLNAADFAQGVAPVAPAPVSEPEVGVEIEVQAMAEPSSPSSGTPRAAARRVSRQEAEQDLIVKSFADDGLVRIPFPTGSMVSTTPIDVGSQTPFSSDYLDQLGYKANEPEMHGWRWGVTLVWSAYSSHFRQCIARLVEKGWQLQEPFETYDDDGFLAAPDERLLLENVETQDGPRQLFAAATFRMAVPADHPTSKMLVCRKCGRQNATQRLSCEGCGEMMVPAETNRITLPESITIGIVHGATANVETTPESKLCPFCAEEIRYAAIKCRYCGEMQSVTDASFGRSQRPRNTGVSGAYPPPATSFDSASVWAGSSLLAVILYAAGVALVGSSIFLPWVEIFGERVTLFRDSGEYDGGEGLLTELSIITGLAAIGCLLRIVRLIPIIASRVWAIAAGAFAMLEVVANYVQFNTDITDRGGNYDIGFYALAVGSVVLIVSAVIDRRVA